MVGGMLAGSYAVCWAHIKQLLNGGCLLYVVGGVLGWLLVVLLAYPDTLHHPDNYCYVDRYVTPKHIVPEWYFLPFYSMLRACSSKVLGVVLLGLAVVLYSLLLVVSLEGHYSRGIHSGLVSCLRASRT